MKLTKCGSHVGIMATSSPEDEDASDQDLLVVERKTFKSLYSSLVQQCGCLSNPSWTIASFIKMGHVAIGCSLFAHTASSHVVPECCLVIRNYMNFSLFAGMGVVKQKYICSGGG
ncbi:hypothetical protein EMCRGX_G000991 [Ephydatia muelleri]